MVSVLTDKQERQKKIKKTMIKLQYLLGYNHEKYTVSLLPYSICQRCLHTPPSFKGSEKRFHFMMGSGSVLEEHVRTDILLWAFLNNVIHHILPFGLHNSQHLSHMQNTLNSSSQKLCKVLSRYSSRSKFNHPA